MEFKETKLTFGWLPSNDHGTPGNHIPLRHLIKRHPCQLKLTAFSIPVNHARPREHFSNSHGIKDPSCRIQAATFHIHSDLHF